MVTMAPVLREQQSHRQLGPTRKFAVLAVMALGVVLATAVGAIDDVWLHIERVEGDGWVANDIAVELGLPREATTVRANVARLHVPAMGQTLTNVRIECPKLD